MMVSNGALVQNLLTDKWIVLDPVDDKANVIKTLQPHGMIEIRKALTLTKDYFKDPECLSRLSEARNLESLFRSCHEYVEKNKDRISTELEPSPIASHAPKVGRNAPV